MSTHIYCVLPAAARAPMPPGLVGVDDAPVRALAAGTIVAWISDLPTGAAPSVDGIRAHDAVVQAALETGTTPAPVRYGQRFTDDVAARDALERVAASVDAMLETVQGSVEMTLILTPSTKRMMRDLQPVIPEMLAESPGSGRRYLEALVAREAGTGAVRQALDALTQRLTAAVQRMVRRSTVHEQLTRMPLRTMSHLIAKEFIEPYREALSAVKGGADFRFLVVGPRAPYSFCALGSSGDGHHGIKLAD
ncbi:MAG TPA: GvpL/GvpF family gas vesicle protein [Gemmatimonadaceae bacterium]|nr:GvpL/GvpF family gas vesicle protein [Gemmatimonadaceae bacterium]